jgi:hypothetical protein
MPPLPSAFVSTDSPIIYKVKVEGQPDSFDTPRERDNDTREVVHLSNAHALNMRPFPVKSYRDHIVFKEYAIQLAMKAADVSDLVFRYARSSHSLVCAITMLAWHLVDDDANILQFSKDVDFTKIDVAIWAVLAVFRHMWHLHDDMSEDAMNRYLDCFCRLVGILNLHNVTVRVSYQAVKKRGKSVAEQHTEGSHMCAISPVFVPENSPVIYRVNVPGHRDPYDAPVGADDPEGRPAGCEVVHLWQDPTSVYVLQPLGPRQYRYSDDPQRTARILESRAELISDNISRCHVFNKHVMCAYILMAWHLVDNETSVVPFYDELNFREAGLSVWAVVVVFRNLWAFRPHLSKEALHRYLTAFYQLVSILNSRGVIVRITHSPGMGDE